MLGTKSTYAVSYKQAASFGFPCFHSVRGIVNHPVRWWKLFLTYVPTPVDKLHHVFCVYGLNTAAAGVSVCTRRELLKRCDKLCGRVTVKSDN